jgi:gluconate 2-dehydrogenase
MPSLLVSRALPGAVMHALAQQYEVTTRPSTQPMSQNECARALVQYDAVLPTLGDKFTRAAFETAPGMRCRMLANFGVGYNHIDVEAARTAGIVVSNTPGAVTKATADIAMTLILMAARRAGEGERLVRSGAWKGWHPVQMLGMHLGGKTVGIIGMGRIGREIARKCHAGFDMDVVFFNRSPVSDPGVPARRLDTLKDVMNIADIVVVAVPGGAGTFHLINESALNAMQGNAILVNISRGDVIAEPALVAALEAGLIAGAGLDVYENEPHIPDALLALDNVVLLPHLGTNAEEVRSNMGMMAVASLDAFFAGNTVPNAV